MALVAATAKNIEKFLNLDKDNARSLAAFLKESAGDTEQVDLALDRANELLQGYGVEPVNGDYQVDRYYYSIVLLYVNRGDTYEDTILYETDTEKFYVGSWGDWVEYRGKKYGVE